MKNYIKGGLKVLSSYAISLIFFVVFLYTFIIIDNENFLNWLQYYSLFNFLLLFAILYSEYKRLGKKERRPQYDLNPYPVKGLIYGIVGFLPVIILELIYPFIAFNNEVYDRIKELVLDAIMGPVFFIIKIGNRSVASYVIASSTVPIIVMLAYLAGYYGFDFKKLIGKKNDVHSTTKTFKKSPWNPAVNEKNKKSKGKKKP
jgi:hypothetical protein